MHGAGKNLTTNNWKLETNFGEQIWLEYKYGGITVTNTATIGKDIKTFTLNIAVMTNATGVACADITRIANDIKVTQQRFAQSNIRAVTNSTTYFGMPPTVATNWHVNNKDPRRTLTLESKAIIDAVGTTPQDLCLIYVPSLRYWDKDGNPSTPNGTAVAKYFFDTSADADYIGTAFLAVNASPLAPIHEILHLLGVRNHERDMRWNLMFNQDLGILGITGPKRLEQPQIDLARTNQTAVLYLK
jgi:hypothetical protein